MRSRDEQPVRVRGSQSMDETSCSSAITGQPLVIKGPRKKNGIAAQAAGCYIMPMEYSATSEDPVVHPCSPFYTPPCPQAVNYLMLQQCASQHIWLAASCSAIILRASQDIRDIYDILNGSWHVRLCCAGAECVGVRLG